MPRTSNYLRLMGVMSRVSVKTRDMEFTGVTVAAVFVFLIPCLVLDLLLLPFVLLGKALSRASSS